MYVPARNGGVGERHPGRQDADTHLARTGSGIVVLHHAQDLGPTEVIDDHALQRPHLLVRGSSPG